MSGRELALDRDPSSRFMPWIVAALSFVVAIAIGAAFSLAALTASWGDLGGDRVTVRVTGGEGAEAQVRDLVGELGAMAEVTGVEALPRADVARLLSPWIGDLADSADEAALPLPHLIEVRLDAPTDARAVEARLDGREGVVVDRADTWLKPLQKLAGMAGLVAGALAAIAIGVIVLVTVFATRAALSAQQDTIELLRLIGAGESFIAKQFQRHAMWQALAGGAGGVTPGLIVIGFGVGAARLESSQLLDGLSPTLAGWIAMAVLPLIIALVATLTARYTVFGMLRKSW